MSKYYILPYVMNDSGEAKLVHTYVWRENDTLTNWSLITSLADKYDEVLITPIDDYNRIMCEDYDLIHLHMELTKYSTVIYCGSEFSFND